jgi:hypothetical protein
MMAAGELLGIPGVRLGAVEEFKQRPHFAKIVLDRRVG